jgi:LIVCS family branched-chain amino acid:cation transporter
MSDNEGLNLNTPKKEEKRAIIVMSVGFMVFSTFFGAGNLLFPTYMGILTGDQWFAAVLGFILGDAVLGVIALMSSGKYPGTVMGIYYRVGFKFMGICGGIGLFLGSPVMVLPRTASVSYENGLSPLLGLDPVGAGTSPIVPIIFFVVYFGLATFCVFKPTKILDILGKYLTPVLLVVLIVVVGGGIIKGGPTGDRVLGESSFDFAGSFGQGLLQGYLTQDSATGALIGSVIIMSLIAKNVKTASAQQKSLWQAGIVAVVCLGIIYIFMTWLGAMYMTDPEVGKMWLDADGNVVALSSFPQATLLNYIIHDSLGTAGTVMMALVVWLATFTTAVGSISMVGQFFMQFSNGKLKFKFNVIVGFAVAFIMSSVSYIGGGSGVAWLMANLFYPIAALTVPLLVSMIVLNMFTRFIKNDNVFRVTAIGAILVGACDAITTYLAPGETGHGFMTWMYGDWNPLAAWNLAWVPLVLVFFIISWFVKYKGYEERPYLREHKDELEANYFEAMAAIKAKKAAQ